MALLDLIPTTIASGTALSAAVLTGEKTVVGFLLDPTAWTAASLTFQNSVDGTTYQEVYDDTGTELAYSVAAFNTYIAVDPTLWQGINQFIIRSGTLATPVNQAAARTINVVVRALPQI
ncbi:MAG: hypothetical protein ACREEN_00500 [Stellaceae bacterium]